MHSQYSPHVLRRRRVRDGALRLLIVGIAGKNLGFYEFLKGFFL